MINKIHLAMIQLYKGDAKRIQHFCKVHSYAKLIAETEKVDKKCLFTIEAAAFKAYHNNFKTTCGKMICREIFNI